MDEKENERTKNNMKTKTAFFTRDRDFYRRYILLTLTIAAQNVITQGVNLADSVMLGAYSEVALSGVALVNQIQFLLQMLVIGAGEGIVVLAARSWGRGEVAPIRRISAVGMMIGMAMTTVMWAIVFIAPHGVLRLLTPQEHVIAQGVIYLRIVCFTYFFFAVTQILLASMRSVETARIGLVVSVTALFVNIFFNYILIFGKLGMPALGVRGAAIATLISRVIETGIVLVYVLFVDRKVRLKIRDFFSIDRSVLRDFYRVSLPVIGSGGMWGIAQTAQTAILGHLGQTAIAANSIAATVFAIFSVACYGSANATAVLVGKLVGEGKAPVIRPYIHALQAMFCVIGVSSGALLFFGKNLVLTFYSSLTPETYTLSKAFLTVLAITLVGTSYQVACTTGIIRGGGDTKFVLILDAVFMWLIVIPLAALAAFFFRLDPVIVFVCLKCDQILKCAVAFIRVNCCNYRWIKKIDRGTEVESA